MDELLERVSERLREMGFIGDKNISKSTLEKDIQFLKNHKNAPIKCKDGHFHYTDPKFNLAQVPLKAEEIKILQDAFGLLRQFPNLPHLDSLEAILQKLERHDTSLDLTPQVIQFETNPNVTGLNWLGKLYESIRQEQTLHIVYRPFNQAEMSIYFNAYLLKEWRNRWFVIGRNQEVEEIWTLALDRIEGIHPSFRPYKTNDLFDPINRYEHVIGVTVNDKPVQEIRFRCDSSICGYLETKPIHPSQKLIQENIDSKDFSVHIIPNQEARGEFLRFGPKLVLLSEVNFH